MGCVPVIPHTVSPVSSKVVHVAGASLATGRPALVVTSDTLCRRTLGRPLLLPAGLALPPPLPLLLPLLLSLTMRSRRSFSGDPGMQPSGG